MKLRNKKTGAIYSIEDIDLGNNQDGIWLGLTNYNSLAKLNEEWEDFEEDKRYWYIDVDGEIMSKELAWFNQLQDDIGNRFETKEEAEKAVEKLRAWKRLKDKDFQFHGHNALGFGEITFSLDFEDMDDEGEIGQLRHDLDLLFGGEQ